MKVSKFGRFTTVAVIAVASSLALAACASGSGSGAAPGSATGSLASTVNLKGVTITVGSKEAPEGQILGEILVEALTAAGAKVTDKTNLTGTSVVRAALLSGQIDLYPEYTGTAWLTIFKQSTIIRDSDKLFAAVRTMDAKNGVSWFAKAPLNDSYGLGAAPAAKSLGVKTTSQYATLTQTHPEEATLCAGAEFRTRDDGLPGLEKAYGFTQSVASIFQVEDPVIYQAVDQKKCNFLYLTTTDPRIEQHDVTVLQDDKNFFPIYNPAVSMRSKVYNAHEAEYNKLFEPIMKLLTTKTMTALNAKFSVDGLPAAEVAHKFLVDNKFI
jgi:osmoprotectant transport system substrate-binding protein